MQTASPERHLVLFALLHLWVLALIRDHSIGFLLVTCQGHMALRCQEYTLNSLASSCSTLAFLGPSGADICDRV